MPVNYAVLPWYAKVTKILQNDYFSFGQTPSVLHAYWYEDYEDLLAFNCAAFYSLLGFLISLEWKYDNQSLF